jgi:hypothetical protein
LQKEKTMPRLTIVNSCEMPVVVTLNGKDKPIAAGGQIAGDYSGQVSLQAKPGGQQAGLFRPSGSRAQDMVGDINLTVAVVDTNTAQLGFT